MVFVTLFIVLTRILLNYPWGRRGHPNLSLIVFGAVIVGFLIMGILLVLKFLDEFIICSF